MNCIHDAKNNYQKIECDMHAGTYKFYMCTSSACNDCKETINGLLSSCAGGITHFCYPKTTPNYSKFVGKNFARDNMYNEPNCEGDIFLSTVYPDADPFTMICPSIRHASTILLWSSIRTLKVRIVWITWSRPKLYPPKFVPSIISGVATKNSRNTFGEAYKGICLLRMKIKYSTLKTEHN